MGLVGLKAAAQDAARLQQPRSFGDVSRAEQHDLDEHRVCRMEAVEGAAPHQRSAKHPLALGRVLLCNTQQTAVAEPASLRCGAVPEADLPGC